MKILQFFPDSKWYFSEMRGLCLMKWQNLKHFTRSVHEAKTPYFWIHSVDRWTMKKKHWCCPFHRDTRVQIFQIPNKVLCCHVRFHFRFIDPSECWETTWAPSISVESNSVCGFGVLGFFGGFEWVFLYSSSVLVDKPVVVQKGFPDFGRFSPFLVQVSSKFDQL